MKAWRLLSLNTYNNPSRVIASSERSAELTPKSCQWRSNLSYLFCLLLTAYCLLVFFGCASAPPKPLVEEPRMEVISTSIAKDITKGGDFSIPLSETDNFSPEDSQAVVWVKLKDISGEHTLRWEWYDPRGNLYYTTGNYPINKDGRLRRYSTIWHKIAIKGEKAGTLQGKWKVRVLLDNVDLIASKEFEVKALLPPPPPAAEKPPIPLPVPPVAAAIPSLPLGVEAIPMLNRQEVYAIVIGIDYKERSDIPPLQYPSQDARKVSDILKDPKYGGVPDENIELIQNENATKNRMLRALTKIKNWDGYVFVYFSGHGAPVEEGGNITDALLVPDDVDITEQILMEQSSIKVSYLQNLIDKSQAKGVMVALDACFSGRGGGKPIAVKGGKPLFVAEITQVIKTISSAEKLIVTSSDAKEKSWEDEKEIKGGIFSHYLIEGMKGGGGKDVWVKANKLANYIKENVARKVKKLKGEDQHPQVFGGGDFAVTRNWDREVYIKGAEEKLNSALKNAAISLEQLNRATAELKDGTISDILQSFLDGTINEKAFGKLYK